MELGKLKEIVWFITVILGAAAAVYAIKAQVSEVGHSVSQLRSDLAHERQLTDLKIGSLELELKELQLRIKNLEDKKK